MKPPLTCPACQSNHTEVSPEQPKVTVFSFHVVLEHRCADCGHQWEPHAPWWLLILCALVALGMLVSGVQLLMTGKWRLTAMFLSVAGCIGLHGFIIRMSRKWKRR